MLEALDIAGSERELAALAGRLVGGAGDGLLTPAERHLADGVTAPEGLVESLRAHIGAGGDPLGDCFCRLRSRDVRRRRGAVYTPAPIVASMVQWATRQGGPGWPARIVDPGAGSGRFLFAAARAFPEASLVAVEVDPLAALLLRANASVLGVADRLTVHVDDYRRVELGDGGGPTLFIGNPPYVRHHDIDKQWKDWLAAAAADYGLKASRLAGLHVHFFLRTRQLAKDGDCGVFVTSSEWLDVNYGDLLRKLLIGGLGGSSIHVLAASAMPFADAATTGAITGFRVGRRVDGIRLRSVDDLAGLKDCNGGRRVPRARLAASRRWSELRCPPLPAPPPGRIELGELCRVHRGQVTGCNAAWIAGGYRGRLPQERLFPTVTRARELIRAGERLAAEHELRHVIDLPADLGELDAAAREDVRRFLDWARGVDAHRSYVARNRRAWWAVNLRAPAPILCTYMARRPPAFVRNGCGARHLNIAHGLYPRAPMTDVELDALAAWLRHNVGVSSGRTYAGGLTKFEPKELERVLVPPLAQLGADK